MSNIISSLFRRRMLRMSGWLVSRGPFEGRVLLEPERWELYETCETLRAIHTLIAGAAGRMNWRVVGAGGVEKESESAAADAICGLLLADWMVLGAAYVTSDIRRASWRHSAGEDVVRVAHPAPPLEAAASLMLRLQELDRAERQAYFRQGAMAAAVVKGSSSGLVALPQEREETERKLQDMLRRAGAAGVTLLPVDLEFKRVDGVQLREYGFDTQRLQLVREVCNLFGVDSSLLNDPENKTYSNKTEAQKALYVNVIIPAAYHFARAFTIAFAARGEIRRLAPDASGLEPMSEYRMEMAVAVEKLVAANIITTSEARRMLAGAGWGIEDK